MRNMRFQKTFFTLLLLSLLIGLTQERTTFNNIDDLQSAFQKKICGGCKSALCIQTKLKLEKKLNFTLIPNPVEHNKYNITKVVFETNSTNQTYLVNNTKFIFETQYILAMPVLRNKNDFKGVIAYFHGTIFNKSAVPSNLGPQYQAIIGLYIAQGYAVLLINYPGLGKDYKNVHPYVLNPFLNIQCMIISLNKAYNRLKEMFGVQLIPLFVSGFSEGGSYSLFFAHCITKPWLCPTSPATLTIGYRFKLAAGLEGAYDIEKVVWPFLTEDVSHHDGNKYLIQTTMVTSMAKPGLAAMAINSFSTYNSTPFPLKSVVNDLFFQMTCTGPSQTHCNVDEGRHFNISYAFVQPNLNDTHFSESFAFSAMDKYMNGWKYGSEAAILSGSSANSILSLFNSSLFTSAFNQTVKEATFVGKNYGYENQTFLFSLHFDSVVSPLNLHHLNKDGKYKEMIFANEDYKVCDLGTKEVNVDHLRIQLVANIYALKYFDPSVSSA